MTLELIAEIAEQATQFPSEEQMLKALREKYRNLHFTFCSDDDVINGTPVYQTAGLNVYLVDGRDHCLSLTKELDCATGLLLAEVNADE